MGIQPSGTSHGVGNTRHSFVNGLRAGATTWMQTTAAEEATLIPVNFPSGYKIFTPPKAIGIALVIRSEPMKSEGASGKNS